MRPAKQSTAGHRKCKSTGDQGDRFRFGDLHRMSVGGSSGRDRRPIEQVELLERQNDERTEELLGKARAIREVCPTAIP